MKPAERTLDVDSTLTGEKVGMTIDQGALAHIMAVLTDLYSDPELAVIREYSTNALDSHVEAGTKRPIEVTTPTPLSPFFRVRDYGIGLDADGIANIYSRYGASTKRESNEVVGMLGLGCKSALTYCDQFTLTGIKDGRAIQVSISRDEDGSGSMTIVSDEPTTLENGVEVVVPAKRGNNFERKAESFFKFWQEGTVLLNSEKPERIDGMWVTPNICLMDDDLHDEDVVVMGNVAYPMLDIEPVASRGARRFKIAAFVDIGEVQFTPSREALQATTQTKAKVAELRETVKRELNVASERQVASAPTALEAVERAIEARKLGYDGDGLMWRGHKVPVRLNRQATDDQGNYIRSWDPKGQGFLLWSPSRAYRKSGEWNGQLELRTDVYYGRMYSQYNGPAVKRLWFEGFDGAELTPTKHAKLAQWATDQGVTIDNLTQLIFVKELSEDERRWIDSKSITAWADVDAIKIKKDAPLEVNGRPRGSYAGRQDGSWSDRITAESIDTSKPLYYIQGNTWAARGSYEVRLDVLPVDATLIAIPANRLDKFLRDFPMAKTFAEGAQKAATAWWGTLTDDQRAAVILKTNSYGHALFWRKVEAARLKDPQLRKLVELCKLPVTSQAETFSKYSRWLPATDTDDLPQVKHVTATYPLAYEFSQYTLSGKTKDHVYLYLNAAYAAGRSGA